MNLKKNLKKKNEQKLRVCRNVNGMEGTAVGECASLVGKVAHVTAGLRAACCLAENSFFDG